MGIRERSKTELLKFELQARAASLLAYLIRRRTGEPMHLTIEHDEARIEIHDGPGPAGMPGFFSPIEWRIVESLQKLKESNPHGIVLGKNIAFTIGANYDAPLKFIIKNLVDRGVLSHDDESGYHLNLPKTWPEAQ